MAGAVKLTVQVTGHKELMRALKAVGGEVEAPEVKSGVDRAGQILSDETSRRGKGGIGRAVTYGGVKGPLTSLRAVGRVKHPGSRSMEFGRKYWPVNGSRRRHDPGQRPNPYLGVVKGDAAIGAVRGRVQDILLAAYAAEWERIRQ